MELVTLQLATVIGNPNIKFLNRESLDADEFDSSTAVCKISTKVGDGNAFFVGGVLQMLLTNMHVLAEQGKVEDQEVRLRCGSKGNPPVFDFDQVIRVKVEAQGRHNLSGNKEFPEEDVVLLSVVNADAVFKDYRHFVFSVTEVPDDIDSLTKSITGSHAIGVLRTQSYPGFRTSITTQNGTQLEFYPEELFRSESCGVFKDQGGLWSNNCSVLPGSSGSPAYVDKRSDYPRLVGMNTRAGSPDFRGQPRLYDAGGDREYKRNDFIPLCQIHEILKQNKTVWKMLRRAEMDDSVDEFNQFGAPKNPNKPKAPVKIPW